MNQAPLLLLLLPLPLRMLLLLLWMLLLLRTLNHHLSAIIMTERLYHCYTSHAKINWSDAKLHTEYCGTAIHHTPDCNAAKLPITYFRLSCFTQADIYFYFVVCFYNVPGLSQALLSLRCKVSAQWCWSLHEHVWVCVMTRSKSYKKPFRWNSEWGDTHQVTWRSS